MVVAEKHKNHGGLYDRGTADSYYGRGPKPHYWPDGTYNGSPVNALTSHEEKIYMAGYNDNEADGHFKDWGVDQW